ncbi:flagellar hook-associated protein 2 [Fredinandcohnia sp. 179-A 10B2 NHS]|uniref:flagellar hook-associated protein 2 n=1 Tax=Fredinandcohnia sp. 179-A 10B2 NHS TaxID=3235176 RepID=UPI0039A20CD4
MNMRIGGLASGMDIDQIVTDLMKAERIPLNKLNQKKQIFEWQRDQYREMNKLLAELDTMSFNMTLSKAYQSKTVTSSNSSVITATATNTAANGSYKIKVDKLATAASRASETTISAGTKIDPTKPLNTQFTANSYSDFTIETFNEDGSKNTVTLTFDPATDSLNTVIKKITESNLGVRAFYDNTSDRVVMERTKTGDFNKTAEYGGAEIGFTAGFLTEVLKFNPDKAVENGGTNAEFTYNGVLPIETTKNEYTINNLTLKFNAATGQEETINVSHNTEDAFNNIVQYINKYNELIEKVNGKITETRYRDYQPLSDEEKEGMTEDQVKKWEERAQSGLLRNDSILSGALNQMRMDFYTPLSGAIKGFKQLSDIGITTTKNYLDRGKLTINEEKLRQKLQENPDAVFRLFSTSGTTEDTQGIAQRVRKTIKGTIANIEAKAGKSTWTNQQFTIGRNLSTIDSQIDRFEDRLSTIEKRYWRQFTEMEKAIQKANSQSAYLMQQFIQ